MKKITLIACICLNFFGYAQQRHITLEVKENIKARVDAGDNVSIVVGYFDGDEVDFYSYGKTAVKDGVPVDENSVFEIGSISKVFTAILLADKIVKGEMKLSDPISKYLPKHIKTPKKNRKRITLKDLATHSSGLPRLPNNMTPANLNNPYVDYTTEQLYSFISNYKLNRAIGLQLEYSNLGAGLLGHILELQSDKNYEDLIIESIAAPLKMDATRVKLTRSMKVKLALGHRAGRIVENWDLGILAGAGGIRSTAKDMVTFLQANVLNNTFPIKEAMLLSHKQAFKDMNSNREMGLGWFYSNNGAIIWHNGGTGGYTSFIGFLKDSNKGVVVLTNTFGANVQDIGGALLDDKRQLTKPTSKGK